MPSRWSLRPRGGSRLPPGTALSGGSLPCISLPLAAVRDHGAGARRPPPLGTRNRSDQSADKHAMTSAGRSIVLTSTQPSRRQPTGVIRIAGFAAALVARYLRYISRRRRIDLELAIARLAIVQSVHALPTKGTAYRQGAVFQVHRGRLLAPRDLRHRISFGNVPQVDGRAGLSPVAAIGRAQHTVLLRILDRTQRIEIDRKRIGAAHEIPRAIAETSGSKLADDVRQPDRFPVAAFWPPLMRPAKQVLDSMLVERRPVAAATNDHKHASSHSVLTPVLPEHEINRLADRVIGTIDRRVAAQRERFGRP